MDKTNRETTIMGFKSEVQVLMIFKEMATPKSRLQSINSSTSTENWELVTIKSVKQKQMHSGDFLPMSSSPHKENARDFLSSRTKIQSFFQKHQQRLERLQDSTNPTHQKSISIPGNNTTIVTRINNQCIESLYKCQFSTF